MFFNQGGYDYIANNVGTGTISEGITIDTISNSSIILGLYVISSSTNITYEFKLLKLSIILLYNNPNNLVPGP